MQPKFHRIIASHNEILIDFFFSRHDSRANYVPASAEQVRSATEEVKTSLGDRCSYETVHANFSSEPGRKSHVWLISKQAVPRKDDR